MPIAPIINQSNTRHPQVIIVLGVIFFSLIAILVFAGLRASALWRQNFARSQAEQMQPPLTPVKRDIKRILLKKTLTNGSIQYIEILQNGLVNIYDADMNLLKSGLSGYYKVRQLYQRINDHLDSFTSDSQGQYVLTIDTSHGQFIIVIDETIDSIINDIIKDIEDITEEVFAPTPTPAPTITPAPNSPSPTTVPTSPTSPQDPTPTTNPAATPTPLPDYLSAPPFDCSDYRYINRPVNISNIMCGIE